MHIRGLLAAVTVTLTVGAAPAVALAGPSTSTTTTPAITVPTTPPARPPTTTTTAPPAPAPAAPKPAPASTARARLSLHDVFSDRTRYEVTVPGRAVRVSGVVSPWVHAQRYELEEFLGRRLVHRSPVALHGSTTGRTASFRLSVAAPRPGTITVRLVHTASPQLKALSAETHFSALPDAVGPGATGPFVRLLQQRLGALHFYIPETGVFDNGTALALDAYHRVLGQGEGHQQVDTATVRDLLAGTGHFPIRFGGQGRHAEGDLSIQVLALSVGRNVNLLFPISSGKPSTPTVLGSWQVYTRDPGYLPDGMFFSSFFTGGYAIHGYDPAPDYPASHGCMRLPIPDAITAYDWLALGDWVDTYYT